MGTLTTYFVGLCTHIQSADVTGVQHRCVLVNGLRAGTINGSALAPHLATLTVSADDVLATTGLRLPEPGDADLITWQIGGAWMRIRNGIPVPPLGVSYTPDYVRGIPSLKTLTPNLGSLSVPIVDGRNQLLASCYFDVDAGTFDGGMTPTGAAMATLTTEVKDSDPVIDVSSFVWGTGSITIRSEALIQIANVAADPLADDDDDFLLQYKVCGSVPLNAGVPRESAKGLQVPIGIRPGSDVGPGCSNSNYP